MSVAERITEVLTGVHVDPSQSVCGCYELTPEDAAHVAAEVVAALGLTEAHLAVDTKGQAHCWCCDRYPGEEGTGQR